MASFGTEFPVSPKITKNSLAKMVGEWAAGIKNSSLKDAETAIQNDEDDISVIGNYGETLQFKHVITESGFVAGARHSIGDDIGREWRTEIVLTNTTKLATLRVRGECIAATPGIETERPKRPFLVKKALDQGWGEADGPLTVQSLPHYLSDTEEDMALAISCILDTGKISLPVVYVSRDHRNRLNINENKLAYDLGGVAHVLIEPSADFSYNLYRLSRQTNSYNGNVGVYSHPNGLLRNYFLGGALPSKGALARAILDTVETFVSNRSLLGGYGWLELQERQNDLLRQKLRSTTGNSENIEEWIASFQVEIDGYKRRISELESEIQKRDSSDAISHHRTDGILSNSIAEKLGRELYPGEFSDRLRLFILEGTKNKNETPHDVRTLNVASEILNLSQFSGRAASIISELKSAATSGKKFGIKMREILCRYGYTATEDGPHIKMSPPDDRISGPVITLPKTPSDNVHGGQNQASDVSNALGLKKMQK